MKIFGKELTFNGNKVYHAGNKPTVSEIGAAASSHTHNYAGSSSAGGAANSALTATKATQDSAGQQINTTYIKGLSVSGRTITYTKGDGTTGTITTQDTNTTYSTGTSSSSGLTKLYTGTGTATDGTMTQAAINTALSGKADSSHTHAYAPTSTGSSISIHADSDSSSTSEYLLLKAGHNELKIASSAGGTTVTKGQDKLTFNGNVVYHTGKKPTPADIGAAASSHTHNYAGSSSAGGAANSANTLATARTINGTSFNGSANITTANWGTARIITIGSTGKSVNGSGSVTWTLREIGAAASNHTHGLVDLNSEAFSGGNDLNTYNSTKTWVARTLNSTTNKPADYFTVVNFGANSNSNFQLAHSYANNSTLYVRGRHDTSGDYTPWAKIYTDKNKPTASEIGAAAASHTHSYLPLSGGTISGCIYDNRIETGNKQLINATSNRVCVGNSSSLLSLEASQIPAVLIGSQNYQLLTDISSQMVVKGKDTTVRAGDNWNNFENSGVYVVSIDGAWGANCPTNSYQWGLLLVIRAENVVTQIYFPHADHTYFQYRVRYVGSWSNWINIGGWGFISNNEISTLEESESQSIMEQLEEQKEINKELYEKIRMLESKL